jgi:bifunctional NMN adenylyltransferase/nudix hydrolase
MDKKKIGVVVGRFQIPDLHDGHRELLNHVFEHNDEVIIFVGCGQKYSFANPLPYNYIVNRLNHNLLHHTKKYTIKCINDCREDEMWNMSLDEAILKHLEKDDLDTLDVCLYGSRDSFLKVYKGTFRNELVSNSIQHVSATTIRKGYHKFVDEDSIDWAKGVIHATGNLYPTSYQCVDIACLDHGNPEKRIKILLGKKENQLNWRLPGGFVDPSDNSLEKAALRELEEETGLSNCRILDYVGSFRVNDYRYVKEPHKIMTCLFIVDVDRHAKIATAGDDLKEIQWFDIRELPENIVDEHKMLINATIEKIDKDYELTQ